MANMSYCRFENTAKDFDDCAEALEDLAAGSIEKLSRSELAAAKRLAVAAYNLVQNIAEHVDKDISDELSEDDVESAVDSMQDAAQTGDEVDERDHARG